MKKVFFEGILFIAIFVSSVFVLSQINWVSIFKIGISAIFSVTTEGNKTVIQQMGNILSSTAFDRQFEQEVELKAVAYLLNANINPKALSDFLKKLAEKENNSLKYLTWMSTHPDTEERAQYILEQTNNKTIIEKPVLSSQTWKRLKKDIH
ncbi:MAG: M48 family metalloprotease [Chitinophagaceae bacterium]